MSVEDEHPAGFHAAGQSDAQQAGATVSSGSSSGRAASHETKEQKGREKDGDVPLSSEITIESDPHEPRERIASHDSKGSHSSKASNSSSMRRAIAAEVKLTAQRMFKVPWSVRVGGALLALCAGMVNAVAFHALGSFVSHTTGTLSKLGLGIEDSEIADATNSVFLLLSFVAGSTACGLIIGKNTVHFGLALYDFGLISVSGLLIAATFSAEHDVKAARYFASAACGLQNGLATQWGGAVIRTTHVTGLLTDVGLLLGRIISMLLRKRGGIYFDHVDRMEIADDISKLSVLLSIGSAFFCGILAGANLFRVFQERAFLVPAGITGTAGLMYMFYRVKILHHSVFDQEEMECVDVKQSEAHIGEAHVGDVFHPGEHDRADPMSPKHKVPSTDGEADAIKGRSHSEGQLQTGNSTRSTGSARACYIISED